MVNPCVYPVGVLYVQVGMHAYMHVRLCFDGADRRQHVSEVCRRALLMCDGYELRGVGVCSINLQRLSRRRTDVQ